MYPASTSNHCIGRQVIYLPDSPTTNGELQKFARSGDIRDGLVVITDNQFAGRGQGANTWQAEPGQNLTFSFLLQEPLQASMLFQLNVFCALSILDLLCELLGPESDAGAVKWPNDVLVGGKKISGILVESSIQGQLVHYAVVGIGLNVNQRNFAFPAATSISLLTGVGHNLENIFTRMLAHLDHRYQQLRSGDHAGLIAEWLSRLYKKGSPHTFESQGRLFEGTILGVDGSGRLEVSTPEGLRRFSNQEIRYT